MSEQENGAFSYASQAQILRAHQRDTSQVARLTDLVSELVRSALGTRTLQNVQGSLTAATGALYYFLTFGQGSQTLGEEYVDIQPYAEARHNFPSRARRLLVVLFHLLPSLLARHIPSSTRLTKLLATLPAFHLALFMLNGRYHSFAKRLAGISYITTDRNAGRMASYEPLGLLLLIPLVTSLLPSRSSPPTTAVQATQSTPDHAPPSELSPKISVLTSLPSSQTCTLCLDPRGTHSGTALTECGHGFCWGCLAGLEKMECPLCRQSLRMERLISVRNL